jgi:restriction system protein
MPTPLVMLSWGTALAIVAVAVLVDGIGRARRLHRQRALSDLAALSWQQFEEVIADAFRQHGYRVQETGGRGTADGGVDLVLVRDGETTVVQAKHWRSDRVGVQLVRELYGVQMARGADRSLFVVQGDYTADARWFAESVGMTLVDGEELLRIIGADLSGAELEMPPPGGESVPACPACGITMVHRTARRGWRAGEDFWGCSRFPACRATVSMAPQAAARR